MNERPRASYACSRWSSAFYLEARSKAIFGLFYTVEFISACAVNIHTLYLEQEVVETVTYHCKLL